MVTEWQQGGDSMVTLSYQFVFTNSRVAMALVTMNASAITVVSVVVVTLSTVVAVVVVTRFTVATVAVVMV